MSSERAGVHTSGALDREKARQILQSIEGVDEYNWPERLDPYLDRLEACVVPDPRLSRIGVLCDLLDGHDKSGNVTEYGTVNTYALRAILRGDQ